MASQQINKLSILSLMKDGETYQLPRLRVEKPTLFTLLGFTDSLVIKMPTWALFDNLRRYVIHGEVIPAGYDPLARQPDAEERNAGELLARFPEFNRCYQQNEEHSHLLMLHKLQYERLKHNQAVRIPQTHFVMVRYTQFLLFQKFSPAIVQERAPGVPLLEMVQSHIDEIKPEWVSCVPRINSRLRALMESTLNKHLNWYIRNFLYDRQADELWYVDAKPSCLFGAKGNHSNIEGIQETFFKYG